MILCRQRMDAFDSCESGHASIDADWEPLAVKAIWQRWCNATARNFIARTNTYEGDGRMMAVVRRRLFGCDSWERMLVLFNNRGLPHSFSTGRCHSAQQLMLMRKTSAFLFCTGVRLHGRWNVSELSPQDGPSQAERSQEGNDLQSRGIPATRPI